MDEKKQLIKEEEQIVNKYVSEKIEELEKETKKLKTERDHLKAKERKVEDERKGL